MNQVLHDLGMTGVSFKISIASVEPGPTGAAAVDFLISTNLGASPMPVHAIASGGELSRLSLAVCAATSKNVIEKTIIFDEVDSGIGGIAAQQIARYLKKISEKRTTLAITHSAQVAAAAQHQIKVEKIIDHDKTISRIFTLRKEERIEEISRMLSGDFNAKISLEHAKKLLEIAH